MEISDLGKIGMSRGEIKIYTALIDIGEAKRSEISKKSGITPSKVYDICNRLIEKGIVSSVKKQGILHFSAANPNRLRDFINQKKEEIEGEEKIIENILPILLSKYKQIEEQADIDVYYGWDGLKTVFIDLENSMSKNDVSLVFGASIGKNPKQADIFFINHQKRVDKRGYKVKIIFNQDMKARKERHEYYDKSKFHEIRYLHQTTFTETYIYKDSVLLLMLLEKPIAIKIKSKEAVDSFTKFFETMWKQAKR
jgi:sugar-specific transcriptional regulator TrmB